MIDLHCHILPHIDDGPDNLPTALEMARLQVADGVTVVACTPHIMPGLYHNSGPQIRKACGQLQRALDDKGVDLRLTTGAENHIVPDFAAGLRSGRLLALADSRYVLVEPPHNIGPIRLDDLFFQLSTAGYVPVLAHPERLTWIKQDYVRRLARHGVWMQITAGSLTGAYGSSARRLAEWMLDEGYVHIISTDAHDIERRAPNLSEGYERASRRVGACEAEHLVLTRPRGVIANDPVHTLPSPPALASAGSDAGPAKSRRSDGGDTDQDSYHDFDLRWFPRRLRQFFERRTYN